MDFGFDFGWVFFAILLDLSNFHSISSRKDICMVAHLKDVKNTWQKLFLSPLIPATQFPSPKVSDIDHFVVFLAIFYASTNTQTLFS